jgi:integrase
MPLTLRPPRKGKNSNYEIRGTLHGVHVERTAGTADRREAQKELKRIADAIKSGEYRKAVAEPVEERRPATFADAALAYLKAGGDNKFVGRIIDDKSEHALTNRPLAEIDQIAIDNAARAVYPDAPPATVNRQFYTPVSAILKRAGIEREVARPKGWRGSKATSWLEPDQARAVLREAYAIEPEFGAFCTMLLYTGMRLSDPLRAKVRDLKLSRSLLYVPDTKNGEPRPVHLPPVVEMPSASFRRARGGPTRPPESP